MKQILRIFLHLSPILALILGYRYGAVALALLVGLGYIKAFKLRQQVQEYTAKGQVMQANSLQKTQNFWQNLTFLT